MALLNEKRKLRGLKENLIKNYLVSAYRYGCQIKVWKNASFLVWSDRCGNGSGLICIEGFKPESGSFRIKSFDSYQATATTDRSAGWY
jgi:hypothetical protein